MQINNLQPRNKSKIHRRVGRGGKRGSYSGRGIKGMGARAGGKFRPAEREILKKIPKLRGYKFKSFQPDMTIVNFYELENKFKPGDMVTPESLYKAGIVRKFKGMLPRVKILGKGDLKKILIFKDVSFSKPARSKVGESAIKTYVSPVKVKTPAHKPVSKPAVKLEPKTAPVVVKKDKKTVVSAKAGKSKKA